MTSASAALQSLDAHRQVVDGERQQMKDDLALLRDLRRRYTQPLSELPPCRGLPAPVASSARKFLVETEAYLMRRMSACQAQSAEIGTQAEHLRDTIHQTANMAHAIAGTAPTPYAYAPGVGGVGGPASQVGAAGGGGGPIGFSGAASTVAPGSSVSAVGFGGGGGGGGGSGGVSNIQTPSIGFNDPLHGVAGASPGGASRYSAATRSNLGGVGVGNNNVSTAAFTSPAPSIPVTGGEIRPEAPMGVLPYMTAASAAYRQQQALAYLAADQGVLPRGWQPASLNPQPLVPYGSNTSGAGGAGGALTTTSAAGGMNVSPSRRMAMEMTGDYGTTFVVLPRASSTEPNDGKKRRRFK